jgi:DNA polymerase III delta subunit
LKEALAAIAGGRIEPVYLVHGDRVLAEPAGARLGAAIGKAFDCEPEMVRRPELLADLVADLRTFSLFASGKVVVVVESGVFADRTTAGALFDEVRGQLPWKGGADDLSGRAKEAALRLLQILRLFDITAMPGQAKEALRGLPDSVFEGKSGRAAKAKGAVEELRTALEPLLDAAVAAGLRGLGDSDTSLIADLLRDGLPERHALVLVESSVAASHPLRRSLGNRGAVVEAGEITVERGKFGGAAELAAELGRETGVRIDHDALEELVSRTLRSEDWRGRPGEATAVDERTTARLAAEYRKLAGLLGGEGRIDRALVRENVEDRGEEDAFAIIDAIGAGKAGEALSRLQRKIAGAEDPVLERLAFFSNLARFCRSLVAVRGVAAAKKIPLNERNYKRFSDVLFPQLTSAVEGLGSNPLKGSRSPYPVFKAYQTCARLPARTIDRLPAMLLETERRLKGDSGEPDAALAELVLTVATARQ